MSEEKLVKLNLGCRSDIREGFINLDIQHFPGVDKVQDAIDLSDYEDNSIDFIVAQHLLEFLPRPKLLGALLEWQRVLKPGCALEIRTTDLSLVTRSLYLNDISKEMGLHHEMVLSLLYGKQRDKYDVRMNGFTREFLQGMLHGLGFHINHTAVEEYDVIITVTKHIPETKK